MKKIFKIIILIVMILIFLLLGLQFYNYRLNKIKKDINNKVQEKIKIETEKEIKEEEIIKIDPITMYTVAATNLRDAPSMDSNIIDVLPINTEVQKIEDVNEWSKIQWSENEIYYIHNSMLSTEKTEIVEQPIVYNPPSGSGVLTKSKGVNYYNGHRETWYSQRVLPGNGLNIPGRHVAEDGTIRDENNYIAVASSDYP